MAFDRLKDQKTAKAIFDKLIKEYPKSEETKTARNILKKRGGKKTKKAK
jgi:TolA-binding protein